MYKCELCGKIFMRSSGKHVNVCKNNPNKIKRGPVSEKTKKDISKSMKRAIREGRAKGWSIINSDINRRSYPEKWFIKNVIQQYNLDEKYTIKEKMPFGKYFLDFAFLELKLDVEIDGQPHFTTKEAIEHDKIRDEYLLKNEWHVYRIAWLEKTQNFELVISDFLSFLQTNTLYRTYNKENLLKYINNKNKPPKYGSLEKYFQTIKEKNNLKHKSTIDKILKSNIDFSKYGWTVKVSYLTGLKNQKVNKWMKRYMPKFYEQKCFKRACIMPRFERGEM